MCAPALAGAHAVIAAASADQDEQLAIASSEAFKNTPLTMSGGARERD
jgi:hypothetical protein